MHKLILIALFTVRFVDYDAGVYNILLEDERTGDMVSWHLKSTIWVPGDRLNLKIEGDCVRVGEVLEGNGKIGSPWAAEDDYYLNRMTWLCEATKEVEQ